MRNEEVAAPDAREQLVTAVKKLAEEAKKLDTLK
jgi:hypothetical protein